MLLARLLFAAALALSLACGFLALYARDVKRNRATTRLFAALGVLFTLATMALGWWTL